MNRSPSCPGPLTRWLRFLTLAWTNRPTEIRGRRQPTPFKAMRD